MIYYQLSPKGLPALFLFVLINVNKHKQYDNGIYNKYNLKM